MTRITVVDDSAYVRKVLTRVLSTVDGVEVTGSFSTGETFLSALEAGECHTDVAVLDLSMPGMGGSATLTALHDEYPKIGVIVFTGAEHTEVQEGSRVCIIAKGTLSLVDLDAMRRRFLDALDNVLEHPPGTSANRENPSVVALKPASTSRQPHTKGGSPSFDLTVIGASTGAPEVVRSILGAASLQPRAAILVVIHMPTGFPRTFSERLNARLLFEFRLATHGELVQGARALIVPAGHHCALVASPRGVRVELSGATGDEIYVPSIDRTFETAAQVFGSRMQAVILSGMGRDGSAGAKVVAEHGGSVVVQSPDSCAIPAMPESALRGVDHAEIVPADELPQFLFDRL